MSGFTLDKWQKEVLDHEGNVTIRAGRQVGKSTVISMKVARFARDHPGSVSLIIAASQKQASWLFDKVLAEIEQMARKREVRFAKKNPPTKTRIILGNKAQIHCLPAGRTGYFIRGLTLDLLVADEAAYIAEEVWRSVTPMIAVSKKLRGLGWVILLSTPFGKGGYFYDSFHDDDFRQFHISSEKCGRIPKAFLLKEKGRMSKEEYAQEYLGEFIDDFRQFFPTELIKKCMSFIEWSNSELSKSYSYYLGVDIARYGGDENAFVIAEMGHKKGIKIVRCFTTQRVSLTDTVGRILKLDESFKFKRIFIDDAGVGGGVMDMLLEKIGKRAVGLNNARRSIDKQGREKGILKEDMYSNTLMLMEAGKLEIISDLKLLKSMKSIVFEYSGEGNVKIKGSYSHLTEALIRACWCVRDRGLRAFIS